MHKNVNASKCRRSSSWIIVPIFYILIPHIWRRIWGKTRVNIDGKPQDRFRKVLADNSTEQFPHLVRPGQGPEETHPYGPEIRRLLADPPTPSQLLPPGSPPPPLIGPCEWIGTRAALERLVEVLTKQKEFGVDTEQHSVHSFRGFTALMQISTHDRDFLLDTIALHDDMHLLRPPFADSTITKIFHGADSDCLWLQRDFQLYVVNLFDTARACSVLAKPYRSLAYLLQTYCHVSTNKDFQKADWRTRPLSDAMLEYARCDAHYLLFLAARLRWELFNLSSPQAGLDLAPFDQKSKEHTNPTLSVGKPMSGGEEDGHARLVDLVVTGGRSNSVDEEEASEFSVAISLPADAAASSSNGEATAYCAGSSSAALYKQAANRSNLLSLQLYEKEGGPEASATSLLSRHISSLQSQGPTFKALKVEGLLRTALWSLCKWRDSVARDEDESLRFVLSDAAVLSLATTRPQSEDDIITCITLADSQRPATAEPASSAQAASSSPSPVAIRHLEEILDLLVKVAEDNCEQDGEHEGLPGSSTDKMPDLSGSSFKRGQVPRSWLRRDPVQARQHFIEKFSCRAPVYENCRIYSGDNRLLCFCDKKKILWYVQRGLAEYVGDEPPSVRLLFEPKGRPEDSANEFYIQSKANACVGCGEAGHYLRYRLVPSCYRTHFPEHLKSHRSHDIVLLCVDCHEVAHRAAEQHKRQVAAQTGVPLVPPRVHSSKSSGGGAEGEVQALWEDGKEGHGTSPEKLRRAAMAILKHGDVMPPHRLKEMLDVLRAYYGRQEVSHSDVEAALLVGMGPRGQRRLRNRSHPYHILSKRALPLEEAGVDTEPVLTPSPVGDSPPSCSDGGVQELVETRKEGGGVCLGEDAASEDSAHLVESRLPEGVGQVCADGHSSGCTPEGVTAPPFKGGEDIWQPEPLPEAPRHTVDSVGGGEEFPGEGNGLSAPATDASTSAMSSIDGSASCHPLLRKMERRKDSVLGHGQHGKRVVEIVLQQGGEEALRAFTQEWRQVFVDSVQPLCLPPGWDIRHRSEFVCPPESPAFPVSDKQNRRHSTHMEASLIVEQL